jgi:hypothetical protein
VSAASKLQIKPGQSVCVLHLPEGVDLGIPADSRTIDDPWDADAVVVFARNRADLDQRDGPVLEAARRDALAWLAYPKAKQLGTDLNRDILWQLLDGRGVKPVRQISIDDVWSALRFRPA